MDLKWGEVLLKKGRLNKKSKKWLVVVSKSEGVPAQLETFESEEHYMKYRDQSEKSEKNKHDKRKVYSMENLQEDDIDKVAKKSTKEFYIDLPLKKEKITLLLDSGDEVDAWHSSIVLAINTEPGGDGLRENILYQSQEKSAASTFNVTIEETEASKRMNLCGKYNLIVTPSALHLEDKETREFKCSWAYEFIRRYGYEKKTGAFTIEAGRRCTTGEGMFVLLGKSNASISTAIDQQVSRSAKSVKQTASITAKLGINHEEKREVVTPPGQRRSAPLSVSIGSEDNSRKIERDSRISLKTPTHTPSQITPEFKQELEEHMSHPPPSPDAKDHKVKDKDKSKASKFTLFRKGDKKKSTERKSEKDSKHNSKIQEEASTTSTTSDEGERRDEPLYDEAVVNKVQPSQPQGVLYEEATKTRENAWQQMGQSGEVHEEDYDKIKKAAKENEGKVINIPEPTDPDDELYDRVDLNVNEAQQKAAIKNMGDSKHIYGISSGKALSEIPDEEDYDTAEFESGGAHQENDYEFEDEEEDPYDDTGLNIDEPTEYTDAISVQKKPPVTDKPIPQRRPTRPAVYEEVR